MPPKIKKRSRSSLKQSEPQLAGILHRVTDAYEHYRSKIVPAVAVIAVVALVIAALSFYRAAQDRKASPLLAQAYEYYSPAAGTPSDYQKAFDLFRDLHRAYPGTMSGVIAQYYAGNSLMALGRREEAIKEYQNFVKQYSGETLLLGLVYQRMGYAYSGQGNQAEALKALEKADGLLGPGLTTMELARLYEAAGNTDEAQKKYKIVAEKLAGSAWAFEAMAKLPPPVLAPASQPAQQQPAQKPGQK